MGQTKSHAHIEDAHPNTIQFRANLNTSMQKLCNKYCFDKT